MLSKLLPQIFLTAKSTTLFGLALIGLLSPLFAQASFQYAQVPDTLVVEMRRTGGEIVDPDPIPLLRIYGDGSVRVHFPSYLKRAGDYELQLSRTEMETLLASLIEKQGLIGFDPLAVRRQKEEIAQQATTAAQLARTQGSVSKLMDGDTTVIEIHLDSYTASDGITTTDLTKKISWYGLQWDAQQYPGVESLQKLAAAGRELLDLCEREDLVKVP